MSALEAGPAPVVDDALRGIDAVLKRLHWRVLGFGHRDLPAGATSPDDGRGIRFHYVASGGVELRRGDGEPLAMQAGDFVMIPHGDQVDVHATHETRLLSGALALDGPDAIAKQAMAPVLFACGFRVHEPSFASPLETMHVEASSDRAGSSSVLDRLADVVASAAVRIWLERRCGSARGLIAPAA